MERIYWRQDAHIVEDHKSGEGIDIALAAKSPRPIATVIVLKTSN